MTQSALVENPSIASGPRGIQAREIGGSYTPNCQQDLIDGDANHGPLTLLSGSTDAINAHVSGSYIITATGVDAITLPLPTAGVDDNLSIEIWSDTLHAHTVTLPSAGFAQGASAIKTVATFAAFRGAGLSLKAYNGTWQVRSQSSITFS